MNYSVELLTTIARRHTAGIQLFQLRLSPSKAEKSNTSAKGLLGIAKKLMIFLAIPSNLSCSYSTFPLCSWTTLIEIAVCEPVLYSLNLLLERERDVKKTNIVNTLFTIILPRVPPYRINYSDQRFPNSCCHRTVFVKLQNKILIPYFFQRLTTL